MRRFLKTIDASHVCYTVVTTWYLLRRLNTRNRTNNARILRAVVLLVFICPCIRAAGILFQSDPSIFQFV